jgi:hypothetical protein
MPKFVYKLLAVIFLLTGLNVVVMIYLDPNLLTSKLIFTLLFFLSLTLLIPLFKIILTVLFTKEKMDFAKIFKDSLKANLIIISGLLFLKLFKIVNNYIVLAAFILLLVVIPSFNKLKKSRKRRIY